MCVVVCFKFQRVVLYVIGFNVCCVIDGPAGLVECKTKDKRTEAARAEELYKGSK